MRSTRARLLRQDQLLVERDAVHKITKVDHAIPHNTGDRGGDEPGHR
jgi:hypothetical protein